MSDTTILSIHDFVDLFREMRRSSFNVILSRFRITRKGAIRATWDREGYPNKNWSAIKLIREEGNRICTGDPHKEYFEYVAEKYLRRIEPIAGLSVGSGKGAFEIAWAEAARFKELLGIDISQKSVERANLSAQRKGKPEVVFICGDIVEIPIQEEHFDIVFAHASLHHFHRLERVIEKIKRALKPDGLFIVDEYVGPRRMQYTRKQLSIANDFLREIPPRYRQRWNLNSLKNEVHRNGLLRMILADPSEGIESDKILPLVKRNFKTLELALRGGTILCPLFHDIGHNFRDDDPEANRIVEKFISAERTLIEKGEIKSDYIIGIFQK